MSERKREGGRVGSGRSLRLSCPSIIPQREDPGFALRLLRRLKSNGKQRSSTDAIVHVVMATSALFQFAGRPQLNPPASRQFNEATTTTEGGGREQAYIPMGAASGRAGGRWPNKMGLCRRQAHHSLDFPAPALLALHRRMPARENRCHIV